MKQRDFTRFVGPFLCQAESQAYTYSTNELAFMGGDIIIVTGSHKSDTFVVHSSVLAEKSDYFRRMLSEDWQKAEPAQQAPVWGFELVFDFETKLSLSKNKNCPLNTMARVPRLI